MNSNTKFSLKMIAIFCVASASLIALAQLIEAQPTASVNLFSPNKIDDGKPTTLSAKDSAAEQSFHQFINSKPTESTVIGEIKPNATALELMMLRNKIANTILTMQEMEKQSNSLAPNEHATTSAECYIEVTRKEKIQGKCHRAISGLPICQSDNYMTISSECN